ncbi:hypothetical protein DSECCO2_530700 [anaerobic digester metagenome]
MGLTFKVGGVEYIQYVVSMRWSRNDLDDEDSGRTLDGTMQRSRIVIKRKLAVNLKVLKQSEMEVLTAAIEPEFIDITFLDPQLGEVTKTFYGSTVESGILFFRNDEAYWEGTTFNLVER